LGVIGLIKNFWEFAGALAFEFSGEKMKLYAATTFEFTGQSPFSRCCLSIFPFHKKGKGEMIVTCLLAFS